jgi:hypothetical protein
MAKADIDLPDSHPIDEFYRPGEILNGIRREHAVRLQGNPRPFQDFRDYGREKIKAAFLSGDILSQAIKTQEDGEPEILQETQNVIVQKAAVRSERIVSLVSPPFHEPFHLLDGLPDLGEGQKRLSAVKVDEALLGKERLKKADSPVQNSRIQSLPPLLLITIDAIKIALISQYDR